MNSVSYGRALNGLGQVPRYTPGQLVQEEVIGTGLSLDMASFDFSYIPPGTFIMGSSRQNPEAFPDEYPQHQVTLTRGFLMGRTEVTQKQWISIMGTNPSYFEGMDLPVEKVTWLDAVNYCNNISSLSGLPLAYEIEGSKVKILRTTGYRLPTEAEWEYACRAGTTTPRYGPIDEIAWYNGNSGFKTHPVGMKKPNPWGLYDMLGNVNEWVQDFYFGYGPSRQIDPDGQVFIDFGARRVLRGGNYYYDSKVCRAGARLNLPPEYYDSINGFRICRSVE